MNPQYRLISNAGINTTINLIAANDFILRCKIVLNKFYDLKQTDIIFELDNCMLFGKPKYGYDLKI